MSWKIYDKTGQVERCEVHELEYNGEWMGECYVTCTARSAFPIAFEVGDWLEYRGELFELNYVPTAVKKSSAGTSSEAFVYEDVKLNGASDELARCDFLDYVSDDNNIHFTSLPTFSFYCESIQDLADRIQANLDRIYTGDRKWTVEVHEEYVSGRNVNISAQKIKVWDALGYVNSEFDANFIIRGRTITIGTAGVPMSKVFKYGKGNGLYEIERTADSEQEVVTRLRVYGSTRNMPARYYNKLADPDTGEAYLPNHMSVTNLMLPSFPYETLDPCLESGNAAELGVREGSVFFDGSEDGLDEIYPSMEGMTADDLRAAGITVSLDAGDNGNLDEVADAEQVTDDGLWEDLGEDDKIPPFTITLKDIGFDLNDYNPDGNATISMKGGMCGGREFEIASCEKQGNKYVLTCNRVLDEGIGIYFPYKDYNVKSGDKYVLLNIEMPDVYVKAAAQRLKTAGEAWLAKNDYVRYTYQPKVDEIAMARQHDEAMSSGGNIVSIHDTLKEGDLMLFEDSDLGISGSITIDKLVIKEGDGLIPKYEVTLREEKVVGTIEKIQNQIDSIAGGQGGGGYTAQQIRELIKAYGDLYFLSKRKPDRTSFLISFLAGAVFGKNGFASGLAGFGAKIDENGRAEMRALTLWEWLQVPELRYNRVEVVIGDKWRSPGAGIIETCTPDTDAEGNPLTTGTCTLKLEDGEIGAVAVDDICMGIWHFGDDRDATEDSDDSKGNFTFAGFATSYFRITGVQGDNNNAFTYSLRPGYTIHPQPQMHFSCRGNFTDTERQTSVYETRTYTRMLWKQNTWEIAAANIALQYGDLSNLSIFGMDMAGYSMYLNSVYFTGTIRQVKPDGTPVMTANDRGAWSALVKEEGKMLCSYYDRVSHNGRIWLCVNEAGTDAEPSDSSADWLLQVDKGADGKSPVNMGGWYSGLHVPYLGIVRLGGATWQCIVEDGTDNPPLWTWTDSAGNRFTFDGGGYALTGEENTEEYLLVAKDGTDGLDGVPGEPGADGKVYYTWLMYADDAAGTGISDDPTGKTYIGLAYNKETPLESNNPADYRWSLIKGTDGVPGVPGADGKTYYTWIAYSDNADGSGMYQQPTENTKYIGIAVNKTTATEGTDPSAYTWSKFRGDKGDSISNKGNWSTALGTIPYLGIVRMAGASYMCNKAGGTTNPPLWTWTDSAGNRFTFNDGGYALTGEKNTGEYELVAEDGAPGKDGQDGAAADKGDPGIPGCIIRRAEWTIGTEWRNDESLNSGTRYLDVALVRDDSTTTGWRAYKCLSTHTSAAANAPGTSGGASYWEEFGVNTTALFTSLIIAKNAHLTFMQGNRLAIVTEDGTVTAGLSGSQDGDKTRIWAGSTTPDSAPFRVSEAGKMVATDAEITGEVNATSGQIAGFFINGNILQNSDKTEDASVVMTNTTEGTFAAMGGNAFPSSMGYQTAARFESTKARSMGTEGAYDTEINQALYLMARGAQHNVALHMNGGYVKGFAVYNSVVTETATLQRDSHNIICSNEAEITLTLPAMNIYDDGRVIRIKRLNAAVKVKTSLCYTINIGAATTRESRPVIVYGNGSLVTGTDSSAIGMNSVGDAVELVWVRDITHKVSGTIYYGAWVQYKMSYL